MKIKTGDTVVIITGKDKGKTGTVLRVDRSSNRIAVEGLNMVTKHVKKTADRAGERLEKEAMIHASNVMVQDDAGNPSRIGCKVAGDGKKSRVYKTTGKKISESFNKA